MHEQFEVSPLKLYSALQRQLAKCGQTKCHRQQWMGVIRNLQKKGVSQAEIDGSEIMAFLEHVAPTSIVHINELISFIDDLAMCELVLQRRTTNQFAPSSHYEKQPIPTTCPAVELRNRRREIRFIAYKERSFGFCIWRHHEVDTGLFERLRYWSFSVPHGLKHLPLFSNEKQFSTLAAAMAYGRELITRMAQRLAKEGFVGPAKSANQFTRYALPDGARYTEWLITAPNLPAEYWGPHFGIKNLVAHVRTTERMSPDGLRILVLEEIQSDWNQELRKAIQKAKRLKPSNGDLRPNPTHFDDFEALPMNPYYHHWLDAALRMMLLLAVNQGCAGVAWLPGRIHAERFYAANEDGFHEFYDEIVPTAVKKLAKRWDAIHSTVQLPTLSRHYGLRIGSAAKKWRVVNLASRQQIGEEFFSWDKAEAFRQTNEVRVLETVSCLFLSTEMQRDIRENGLPCFGAVTKQLG